MLAKKHWLFGILHGRQCMWGCFAGETRKTPPRLLLAKRNPKDRNLLIYYQEIKLCKLTYEIEI